MNLSNRSVLAVRRGRFAVGEDFAVSEIDCNATKIFDLRSYRARYGLSTRAPGEAPGRPIPPHPGGDAVSGRGPGVGDLSLDCDYLLASLVCNSGDSP